MSDLAKSPGNRPTRRAREDRAYRMVLAGGAAAAVAVLGVVLAVIGVIGYALPLLAAVVAAICWLLFRRAVSG
ncbi:MAG: hypothetical protein U0R70_15040 [Solirubrobacteraceae bacterium]